MSDKPPMSEKLKMACWIYLKLDSVIYVSWPKSIKTHKQVLYFKNNGLNPMTMLDLPNKMRCLKFG